MGLNYGDHHQVEAATPVVVAKPKVELGKIGEAEVAISHKVGHPWSGEGEWEIMEIRGKTAEAVATVIQKAEEKFWQTWINGNTFNENYPFGAAMYKPSSIKLSTQGIM